MATAGAKLLKALGETQEYLSGQKRLVDDTSFAPIVEQQSVVWGKQLSEQALPAVEARQISDLLAGGPWTSAQKATLAQKLNEGVSRGMSMAPSRRENQKVQSFEHYFSEKDLEVLKNASQSVAMKCDQIASRLFRLGLHLPSEQTLRCVLQTAVACGAFEVGPDEAYRVLNEIKKCLKQRVKRAPKMAQHIVEYPSSPDQLPEWLMKEAYPDGDAPCSVPLTLTTFDTAVPLRSNAKAMRMNSTALVASSPSSSSRGAPAMPAMQPFMQLMQCTQAFCNMRGQEEVPSLQVLKPKPKRLSNSSQCDSQDSPDDPEQKQLALPAPPLAPAINAALPAAKAAEPTLQVENAAQLTVAAGMKASEHARGPPLKSPSVLALPSAEQVDVVLEAVRKRTESRKRDAETHDEPEETNPKPTPKGGAKSKAKAKAKSSSAKAKAKASAKAKSKGKAKSASEAKAERKEGIDRPPCPSEPGSGTVHYMGGRIQYPKSGKEFRVFAKCSDRCDRKFKITGPVDEVWQRCLDHIYDAHCVD